MYRFTDAKHRSTANSRAPKAFGVHGYAVKTLESKETRASKEITVTHNSVFAAHRLQCRMTNRKNRHPAFCFACKPRITRIFRDRGSTRASRVVFGPRRDILLASRRRSTGHRIVRLAKLNTQCFLVVRDEK